MRFLNIKKYKYSWANLKQELVYCFQIKFDEGTCIFQVVEQCNRIFMNSSGPNLWRDY